MGCFFVDTFKLRKTHENTWLFVEKTVDFLAKLRIIISCMDMQKCKLGTKGDVLEKIAGHKVAVGAKQFRKALNAGTAQQVFLAKNADPVITGPVETLCKENKIEFAWVKSMTELGNACGIEVGAAVATIVA